MLDKSTNKKLISAVSKLKSSYLKINVHFI
jgi:malic enzyme